MSKKNGEYRISKAQLRRMHEAGMTTGAIADALGVHRNTVRTWFVSFGIPTRLVTVFTDDQISAAIERHCGGAGR